MRNGARLLLGAARTLHLGSVSITEDAYREAVHRLIRRDDEVCRTWLREGTEPLTAMEDKTTAGASASDLQTATLSTSWDISAVGALWFAAIFCIGTAYWAAFTWT